MSQVNRYDTDCFVKIKQKYDEWCPLCGTVAIGSTRSHRMVVRADLYAVNGTKVGVNVAYCFCECKISFQNASGNVILGHF